MTLVLRPDLLSSPVSSISADLLAVLVCPQDAVTDAEGNELR